MQQNNKVDERRSHPRVETSVPLKIKVGDFDITTSTKNISCLGAYCQINKYLAPMSKLNIVMLLNNKTNNKDNNHGVKVKCHGVVVRSEPETEQDAKQVYDIAIFFNDISDSEKEKISNYIKNILQLD